MTSFADLHCDTLFECFVRHKDFSCQTHINAVNARVFSNYLQTFAFFVPEKTKQKKDFLFDFIEFGGKVLRQNGFSPDIIDETAPCRAILAVENCDVFTDENEAGPVLDALYQKGVRILSLVYNNGNSLGSGAMSVTDTGLTPLGRTVVSAAEERGMTLDVSHASRNTTRDILDICAGPVLATHSNARSLCDSPRNLPDDQIRRVAESGGLIGINLYPPFLKEREADAGDIIRHMNFMISVAGEDHIAFGCDFDGVDILPSGITDLGSLLLIRDACLRGGMPEETVEKIFFGNVNRFVKQRFGGKR